MRIVLAAAAAFGLTACGGEPAKPAEPTPEPMAAAPAAPAMDDTMKAADPADDGAVDETADGAMFHTDTTKTEKVHLPAGNWTATAVDAKQIQVVGATDEAMPGGATHHVVEVKPLTKDVIAKVKFERRDSADAAAPVTETRTVNFMVH